MVNLYISSSHVYSKQKQTRLSQNVGNKKMYIPHQNVFCVNWLNHIKNKTQTNVIILIAWIVTYCTQTMWFPERLWKKNIAPLYLYFSCFWCHIFSVAKNIPIQIWLLSHFLSIFQFTFLFIIARSNMLPRNTFRPKIASYQLIHESFPFPGWKFRFNTWLKVTSENFKYMVWKCVK